MHSGETCCDRCLRGSFRLWLRITNILLCMFGLAFTGYGIYLSVQYPDKFYDMMIGAGVVMFVVALLGLFTVGGTAKFCFSVYTFFLLILIVCHAVLVSYIFFKRETVLDYINEHSDASDNDDAKKVEDFAKKHISNLGFIALVILCLELISFMIAFFARSRVLFHDVELYDPVLDGDVERGGRKSLLGKKGKKGKHRKDDKTPMTQSQRERMRDKYGAKYGRDFTSYGNDKEGIEFD